MFINFCQIATSEDFSMSLVRIELLLICFFILIVYILVLVDNDGGLFMLSEIKKSIVCQPCFIKCLTFKTVFFS
jgi:hypothetical protein